MVSLAPDLFSTFVVLPLSLPLNSPHLLSPLASNLVTMPEESVKVPMVEDSAALTVHVMPNVGSLVVHSAPVTVALRPVMLGRVPVKLVYLTCQGREPLLTVAFPLAHLLTLPAVT